MAKATDSLHALQEHLKQGVVEPLYVIQGSDAYLLEKSLSLIVKAMRGTEGVSFADERFLGDEISASDVLQAAESMSMFAQRKLVVIREAQKVSQPEFEALGEYFGNPNPSTCMVIVVNTSSKSLDKRKRAVKQLFAKAKVFEMQSYYENELPAVVQRMASRRGVRLGLGVDAYVIGAVGTQLGDLEMAIEKVSLYVNADRSAKDLREVTMPEISEIVAQTHVQSVFELSKALGQKSVEKSLTILRQMLESGEPALRILVMIARHFRIVTMLNDPTLEKLQPREKAKEVGVVPYFLSEYERDARRFSPAACVLINRSILESDHLIKSSSVSDQRVMEQLVLKICLQGG